MLLLLIPTIILVALLDLYVLDYRINGTHYKDEEHVPTETPMDKAADRTQDEQTTGTKSRLTGKKIPSSNSESPALTLSTTESSMPTPTSYEFSSPQTRRGAVASDPIDNNEVSSPALTVPNRILWHHFEEPSPLPNTTHPSATHEGKGDKDGDDCHSDVDLIPKSLDVLYGEDEASVDSWAQDKPAVDRRFETEHLNTPTSAQDKVLAAAERLEDLMVLRASVAELSTLYTETRTLENHLKRKIGKAATLIQRTFHAYQAAKADRLMMEYRRQWQVQEDSAKRIQECWRGVLERKHRERMRMSIVVAQRSLRGFLVRQRHVRRRNAAVKLQSRCRMFLSEQHRRKEQRAIVGIQRTWRCHIDSKHRCDASIVVQRQYRSYRERQRFEEYRKATQQLQSWSRRCLQLRRSKKESSFADCQDKRVVETLGGLSLRQLDSQRERSAARIQGAVHRYLVGVRRKSIAATLIQTVYRSHKAAFNFGHCKCAATSIQRWFRMVDEKSRYRKLVTSIVIAQAFLRRVHARKDLLSFKSKLIAASKIQAAYRRHRRKANRRRQRHAAVLIERWFRLVRENSRYRSLRSSIIHAQALVRSHRARKEIRAIKTKMIATTTIQSAYRCHSTKTNLRRQRDAVILIQRWYRVARREKEASHSLTDHQRWVWATLKIQAWSRASRYRIAYIRCQRATLDIQSYTRMHQKREKYRKALISIVRIQSLQRGLSARGVATRRRDAIPVIQVFLRREQERLRIRVLSEQNVAATKIQAVGRSSLCRANYSRMRKGITRIQSIQRGNLVRRSKSIRRKKQGSPRRNPQLPPRIERVSAEKRQSNWRKSAENETDSVNLILGEFVKRSRPEAEILVHEFDSPRSSQRMSDRSLDVPARGQQAAITIQALVRKYLARKHVNGLRQPAISWSLTDIDISKERSLLDHDEGSAGSSPSFCNPLDMDCALQRRAVLSIVSTFGKLSSKRHEAASTVQNAYLRHRQKPRAVAAKTREKEDGTTCSCCLMERISDCMDALSCREGEQVQEAGTPDAKWGDVGLVDDGGVEIAFPESESDERMDIRASVMEINRNWESQNDYGIVST